MFGIRAAIAFLILVETAAFGATPLTVAHSGYLLGPSDVPTDTGTGAGLAMSFALFPSASGGTPRWTGSCVVPVHGGYYAVTLGDGTCGSSLDSVALPSSGATFLEVTAGLVTLTPRPALLAVPNATTAANALLVGGLSVADLDQRYAVIATGSSPTLNQVLKWQGSSWAPAADANSGGTVTQVTPGVGLTGAAITSSGTLDVNVGTNSGQIPQLDSVGKLPTSTLPPITTTLLSGGSVTAAKLAPGSATGQLLIYNATTGTWSAQAPAAVPLPTGVTGVLPVANGGTGQASANAALNALLPSQAGAAGKFLKSDGTNTTFATVATSGPRIASFTNASVNCRMVGGGTPNCPQSVVLESSGDWDGSKVFLFIGTGNMSTTGASTALPNWNSTSATAWTGLVGNWSTGATGSGIVAGTSVTMPGACNNNGGGGSCSLSQSGGNLVLTVGGGGGGNFGNQCFCSASGMVIRPP